MPAPAATYPHIDVDDHGIARLQSQPGVRVAQLVAEYLAWGWSPDEMARQHPHLTLGEIHAAMSYYYDHEREIARQVEADLAAYHADHPDPQSRVRLKLRAKGLL